MSRAPMHRDGPVAWLTTTDHKKIGILYCVTAFGFFLIGGTLADVMRTELAETGRQLVTPQAYNGLFTIHGIVMIFLFVAPFGIGLANYLIPLQIGAPDMAFPRLNALSYWFFVGGGLLVLLSGFASAGGGAQTGWYMYAPLSGLRYSPGVGPDLLILGLALVAISTLLSGVNVITTTFLMRAPGMTMWRLPIFTWNMVVTSILGLVAFPPALAAFVLLLFDRRLGGFAFDPQGGGDPIIYQHLFWFLGHPEVYILILPFFGVITEIIPVFSRKPLFGYTGFVLATLAIGALSTGVWAHHMFTTGEVDNPFFSAMTLLIAVPTGVKFFNWIGTMWGGRIRFGVPMLFSIGFLLNFLIGGVTGVMLASAPIDYSVSDSYFLVSHFHYTMMGGSVFGIFAAIYFWWPKMTGYLLSERMGRAVFALLFVGFNLTFWPQFVLGLRGMPRRIVDYASDLGWDTPNLVSTMGAGVLTIGVLVFLTDVWRSRRRRTPAGDDPWGGYSLEWATTSPPPEHNFSSMPRIRSERPAFDLHHPKEPVSRRRRPRHGEVRTPILRAAVGLRARAGDDLLVPHLRGGGRGRPVVFRVDAVDRRDVVVASGHRPGHRGLRRSRGLPLGRGGPRRRVVPAGLGLADLPGARRDRDRREPGVRVDPVAGGCGAAAVGDRRPGAREPPVGGARQVRTQRQMRRLHRSRLPRLWRLSRPSFIMRAVAVALATRSGSGNSRSSTGSMLSPNSSRASVRIEASSCSVPVGR